MFFHPWLNFLKILVLVFLLFYGIDSRDFALQIIYYSIGISRFDLKIILFNSKNELNKKKTWIKLSSKKSLELGIKILKLQGKNSYENLKYSIYNQWINCTRNFQLLASNFIEKYKFLYLINYPNRWMFGKLGC